MMGSGVIDVGAYPNNVDCAWTLTVPAGAHVQLTFTRFNTEVRAVQCAPCCLPCPILCPKVSQQSRSKRLLLSGVRLSAVKCTIHVKF